MMMLSSSQEASSFFFFNAVLVEAPGLQDLVDQLKKMQTSCTHHALMQLIGLAVPGSEKWMFPPPSTETHFHNLP